MDQGITIQEVPTGAEPEGVFISEDGHFVYVTSEVGDLVHLIDADSGNVVQDVVVGTRPRRFAATPDGKELWVSTELSGEVYIIDREKFEVKGVRLSYPIFDFVGDARTYECAGVPVNARTLSPLTMAGATALRRRSAVIAFSGPLPAMMRGAA
jgi:hypothetical protein